MSYSSDFSAQGYQVEQELGHNRAGGRVTYLAKERDTQARVVIKQFQFAKLGSSWSSYDAYDREIQLLKELNHPSIPRYLHAFQTSDGFCMVQEYKDAVSLSTPRSFSPDEIRNIAIATLEVLIYLQNRIPPVIHRDIKPENMLVDSQGKLFLVDFGFARVGGGEVGVSSVVKGTLGFMPPEQLFNRQLTEASDLYGLGMTLICLLTGTPSAQIGNLVDISYRVSFKHLVPKLSQHWITWLEKMVEPRLKDRFPNAVVALTAIPNAPLRSPEAHFSCSNLAFFAHQQGEPLSDSVVITNPIPETLLEGRWELSLHPHDPPSQLYRWITIEPDTFTSNQVECHITIDTSQLMDGKTYNRKLLLHTNTPAKTYSLSLQVQTARRFTQLNLLPYCLLALLGLIVSSSSWLIAGLVQIVGTIANSVITTGFVAVISVAIGIQGAAWLLRSSGWRTGATASTLVALIVGVTALLNLFAREIATTGSLTVIAVGIGLIGGAVLGIAIGLVTEKLFVETGQRLLTIILSLMTTTLGFGIGLGFVIGFMNPVTFALNGCSSFVLLTLTIHLHLRYFHKLFYQQQTRRHFIRP